MLRDMLRLDGIDVGRKRISALMKTLSIEALYRKANTSRRNQTHRNYPYRLRGLVIDRPNQVRAMDISTAFRFLRPTYSGRTKNRRNACQQTLIICQNPATQRGPSSNTLPPQEFVTLKQRGVLTAFRRQEGI